jgi:ribosome-associated heat shock protein Hsp15
VTDATTIETVAPQRLDKWLWFARFFKSRSIAARQCLDNKVRVNRAVCSKPSHAVRPGDIVSFNQGKTVRVVKILATGTRRGPASEAQLLYEDLFASEPDKAREPVPGQRDRGAGRPTKAERRAIDAIRKMGVDGEY